MAILPPDKNGQCLHQRFQRNAADAGNFRRRQQVLLRLSLLFFPIDLRILGSHKAAPPDCRFQKSVPL